MITKELLWCVRSRSSFVSLDAIGANQELVSHGHVVLAILLPDIGWIVSAIIDSVAVFVRVIVIAAVIRYDEWIQALKDFGVGGMVICESPNLEQDALMLKELYES